MGGGERGGGMEEGIVRLYSLGDWGMCSIAWNGIFEY
jgi:hypothetical protein